MTHQTAQIRAQKSGMAVGFAIGTVVGVLFGSTLPGIGGLFWGTALFASAGAILGAIVVSARQLAEAAHQASRFPHSFR